MGVGVRVSVGVANVVWNNVVPSRSTIARNPVPVATSRVPSSAGHTDWTTSPCGERDHAEPARRLVVGGRREDRARLAHEHEPVAVDEPTDRALLARDRCPSLTVGAEETELGGTADRLRRDHQVVGDRHRDVGEERGVSAPEAHDDGLEVAPVADRERRAVGVGADRVGEQHRVGLLGQLADVELGPVGGVDQCQVAGRRGRDDERERAAGGDAADRRALLDRYHDRFVAVDADECDLRRADERQSVAAGMDGFDSSGAADRRDLLTVLVDARAPRR